MTHIYWELQVGKDSCNQSRNEVNLVSSSNNTISSTEKPKVDQTWDEGEWELGTFPEVDFADRSNSALVEAIVDSWNKLMKCTIKKGETYLQRFEKLKKERNKKDQNPLDEVADTHPFMNGILRTFFRKYLPSIQDAKSASDEEETAELTYLSNASMYLYTESEASNEDPTKPDSTNADAIEKSIIEKKLAGEGRRPDAAFFQRGTPVDNSDVVKYDSAVREKGLLVSVEAKKNLLPKNFKEALMECQRDYAHVTQHVEASRQMPVGFSIITDGVDWYFLCIIWRLTLDGQGIKFTHRIQKSPAIHFETKRDKTQLAKWLLFVLDLSLLRPKLLSDPDRVFQGCSEFKECHGKDIRLTKVFNSGGRSTTLLWTDDKGDYVQKYFFVPIWQTSLAYFNRELGFLRQLAGEKNIINQTNSVPFRVPRSIWLQQEGVSLENLDISGRRGQQLALIVKRDIWNGALVVLQNKKICHCDIHESNILICLKRNKATLIDFEGAKPFGESLKDSPIRHHYCKFKMAGAHVDKICVAALLECMWSPKKSHFDDKSLVEKMAGLQKNLDELQKNANTTSWEEKFEKVLAEIVDQIS